MKILLVMTFSVIGLREEREMNNREAIEELEWDFHTETNSKKKEAYKLAIQALEQTQWTLITERVPEEFTHVLVCTDAEEIFIASYLGKMNDGTDCFDDDDGMMWEGDVIAWQSLPMLYKEKEE